AVRGVELDPVVLVPQGSGAGGIDADVVARDHPVLDLVATDAGRISRDDVSLGRVSHAVSVGADLVPRAGPDGVDAIPTVPEGLLAGGVTAVVVAGHDAGVPFQVNSVIRVPRDVVALGGGVGVGAVAPDARLAGREDPASVRHGDGPRHIGADVVAGHHH